MGHLLSSNDRPGEYPASYYAATANCIAKYQRLRGQHHCDVCIVGGGYTGLSAAVHLSQRGYKVIVLDAHRVGWGASGRNGGQVCSGQRIAQDKLEKTLGSGRAHQLWQLAQDAKSLVSDIVSRYGIACDLKPGIIHADHRRRYVAHSHRYAEHLRLQYDYEQIQTLDEAQIHAHLGTDCYYGGTIDMGAAHLHPLNFALGLAEAAAGAGAQIFEHSQVTAFEDQSSCKVQLEGGQVVAKFLIFACNGYLDDLDRSLGARIMPINNFIIATEQLPEDTARELIRDDVAVADSKFVVNYFRLSADRRLLFGGGENYSYRFPADIKSFVRPHMLKVYPQLSHARIDFGWGGTLAITVNRLPYIARCSQSVLTACGYSGHGVALSVLAGQILAEAVAGTSERMDLMQLIPNHPFPGGVFLRYPLLVLAMSYYALRDRL